MLMEPLDLKARARLGQLKKIVKTNTLAAAEWASALMEIFDSKLYLQECKAFDEFCTKNFGWELNEARNKWRSAKAWGARQLIKETTDEPISIPNSNNKDRQDSTPYTKNKETESTPAKEPPKPEKPPVQMDSTGTKIPTPALPYWERRNEVQPWLNQISAIKCAIQEALREQDPLFAWIGNPAIDFLSSAYAAISNAKLYAVCTDCQGWGEKKGGCGTCHNTGLISKHHYDVCSRREIKEIRERANALKL